MKSKKKALTDYIWRFGTFPCGDVVKPDGENAYVTPARGRDGKEYWRVRCLPCWRSSAAEAMARLRARRLKTAKTSAKKSTAKTAVKKVASKKVAPKKAVAAKKAPAKKRAAAPARRQRSR